MRANRLFQFFSIGIIFIAIIKIGFHLNFWILPLVFFTIGLVSALWNQRYSLLFFIFLFPFINSTPSLFDNGYPYNFMAPSLFLLSGMVFAMAIKKIKNSPKSIAQEKQLGRPFYHYYVFLLFLFISTIFVLLRWSNLTLNSIAAVGADTPVSPTMQRISFASIFPVVTLFIYFISPYIFLLVKKVNIKEKSVFLWLSFGFFISVALAVIQKISNQSLISDRLGKEIKQFYGGFSDFNALGAFSGMMFIWSTYEIKKNNILGFFTFFISLTGGILSGSRTFLFFIIAGIINLFLNKNKNHRRQHKTIAIILTLGVLVITLFMGSPLRNRFDKGFPKGATVFEILNRISEGRLWMSIFSLETIRDNFISGVGTGNFTFYLTYKNYGKKHIYDLALNDYLLIFTENGLFAFFFFSAFLILLFRRSQKKILIGTVIFALLFNNFFWFPEIFLLFLILAAISDTEKERLTKKLIPVKIKNILILLAVLMTIIFNMIKFNSLHPAAWARETVARYDFGFWYTEEDEQWNEFRWTKNVAGIFIKLNKNGESPEFKLRCGAPLVHLGSKKQKVDIYWKGKLYREVIFKENKSIFFKIKSQPLEAGFLEVKILPDFNLKKMGLSAESRDLGVQFYGSPYHWE